MEAAPAAARGWTFCHGAIRVLLLLVQVSTVRCKQNLSLPIFETIGHEFGPVCVKPRQEYCVGSPRSYQHMGTVLNGSYQAPEFADMNGDGRPDLITAYAENNSVMIFYNQGYGTDGLPVFEASASVIVPTTRRVHALHAIYSYNEDGEMAWPPYLLASVDVKADGNLIIPMLDNVGTITQPELVWRHGDASCLHALDLKSKLVREGVYENVLKQGGELTVMLATGDLDADGDVDLVVQLTWLTFYYEHIGSAQLRHPAYAERPSIKLVVASLRFYGPPVLYDMDKDGDLDIISFVGDSIHGVSAIVYENVGTKYHPQMFELQTHAVADLYASACANLGFECTLTVHDFDDDGHDDLLLGGRDVGAIVVYPQGRATSFLFETEWNNPFDVLTTTSSGWLYQHFVDADGDGDLDMYVRSWLLTPVRTLQVDAYENQGTRAVPNYVLSSTYRRSGGLYYFAVTDALGRRHPETGIKLYDFVLTNGSETVYVARNNNDTNLNISSLSEPEPLFDVDIPAGKIRFFDDDTNGKLEMYLTNAYGDLNGMLESQLYTGKNTSELIFKKKYQQTCHRINVFRYTERMPWRDGLTRPVYIANGSATLNITGCVSDIFIGDYRDFSKATLIATLFPLGQVYQFEPEVWTSYDRVLELSDGTPIVDAATVDMIPVSATLIDLDGDGNAGLIVGGIRGVRSWRSDYCEFEHPCWKGGKCDYTAFHPTCSCSTGFEGPLCDTCAYDHFGKDCTSCPIGEKGEVCSNKGVCNWGNFATGECICTAPFSETDCSEGVCPPGSETEYNFTSKTLVCEKCKLAHYKDRPGDHACTRCPPFSHSSDDRTTCECNSNFYLSHLDGILACEGCPSPMITIKEAATSIHACVCPAGYYLLGRGEEGREEHDHSIGTCVACPPGAACTVPGITLETLPLLPNHWRISATSGVVGRCKLEAACPGTDMVRWKQDVWLKGGKWDGFQDSLCGSGYTAPFCSACEPGHFRRNRRCLQCHPRAVTTRHVTLGFMTVFLLALGAWLAYRRVVTPHIQRVFNVEPEPQLSQAQVQQHLSTTRPHALSTAANPMLRSPIRNAPERSYSYVGSGLNGRSLIQREVVLALPAIYKRLRAVLGVKLRLLIIYLQVVSCLWTILDLDASENTPIDDLMSTLEYFDLDFAALPSYQCVVGDSYFHNILVYTYAPVLLLAFIWVGTLVLCQRSQWQAAKVTMYTDYATTGSLGICFLLFAGASTRLLNFFACTQLDDGHLYNTTDMRVRCDTPSYQGMVPLIVIGIILYPVGITSTYAYLLHLDRPRICARPDKSAAEVMALRDADVAAKRSKFLWSPYEPRAWWYEVAECMRRLSLTAFLSVYQTGKTQQTVAAILLSVIAIFIYDHYMPYALDEDDSMGKVCNYVTLLTFLVALLTKLDYIKRVFITQLLLFLLALSVIVYGAIVTASQLYNPFATKTVGRRRSSLLKRHLKTLDSDAAEIVRLRGLSESQRGALQVEPQADQPTPATPRARTDEMALTGRGLPARPPLLPPLPNRNSAHLLYPQLGAHAPYAFGESSATLATPFNSMLQRATIDDGHSSGGYSSGRYDQHFSTIDNAHGSTLRTTRRPTAEGGDGNDMTDPPSAVASLEPLSLTTGVPQDWAREEAPAPPPPPVDHPSI